MTYSRWIIISIYNNNNFFGRLSDGDYYDAVWCGVLCYAYDVRFLSLFFVLCFAIVVYDLFMNSLSVMSNFFADYRLNVGFSVAPEQGSCLDRSTDTFFIAGKAALARGQ